MKKTYYIKILKFGQKNNHNNIYYYLQNLIKDHSRTPCVDVLPTQVDINHHIAKPQTIWELWRSCKVYDANFQHQTSKQSQLIISEDVGS